MLALVIDTSCAAVTAAVVDVSARARVIAGRVTVDARAHGELLTPSIRHCMDEAGVARSDLGAIVAGVGPGPFTGLRVGLVTASAMADALDLPTYGVCSLDAIALGAIAPAAIAPGVDACGSLLVAGDARRKEIYWARYSDGHRRAGPYVGRAADVASKIAVACTAGAGARLYADVLGAPLLDCDYPPAVALAELAADRIRSGAPSERLLPLYLRRPDAVAPTQYKTVTQ